MDHCVAALQFAAGALKPGRIELWAVGADEERSLSLVDHTLRRARQPLAEVAFALVARLHAFRHIGKATAQAELYRAGLGSECFPARVEQHSSSQLRRAFFPERWDEARLDLPRHRRLGEDHDPRHPRRQS